MNTVSFPGLGIGPTQLDPVAFSVFGVPVMWYGIIITCGMILAYIYGLTRAKIEKVKSDDITDLTLFLIIFGVIGARLYYIAFKLGDFIQTDPDGGFDAGATLLSMVNLRGGGLAIYGGIIAGFLTAFIVARIKRIRFPVLLDIVAPCLMIGQAIGRWGNFMNVEAFGDLTELPWRMGVGANGVIEGFHHPTFLYESLWSIVGFIIVAVFYKKKRFHGQVFLFYGIWYGIGRAWIEGLRTDSLMWGPVRVSQALSLLIVIVSAVLMGIGLKKSLGAQKEGVSSEDADGDNDETAAAPEIDAADEETTADKLDDTEENEVEKKGEDENGKDN